MTRRQFALLSRTLQVWTRYFCAALLVAVPTLLLCIAVEYLTRPGVLL